MKVTIQTHARYTPKPASLENSLAYVVERLNHVRRLRIERHGSTSPQVAEVEAVLDAVYKLEDLLAEGGTP